MITYFYYVLLIDFVQNFLITRNTINGTCDTRRGLPLTISITPQIMNDNDHNPKSSSTSHHISSNKLQSILTVQQSLFLCQPQPHPYCHVTMT